MKPRKEQVEEKEKEPRRVRREKALPAGPPTFSDVKAVRIYVRARVDFQSLRKKMDNRLGRKANGSKQNVEDRGMYPEDIKKFVQVATICREEEKDVEKALVQALKRFPVYTEFLKGVGGVGTIASGWIIGEFNIHKADTVSKMWQFAGLNSNMVPGQKDVAAYTYTPDMGELVRSYKKMDGSERVIYKTTTMIRGDKLTEGFVAPFNKKLRTALVGVLAGNILQDGLLWHNIDESEFVENDIYFRINDEKQYQKAAVSSIYVKLYMDYKQRLRNSERTVTENIGNGKTRQVAWKDAKTDHINRAALRYMVKMFLKDLYVAWRTLEGLPVRPSYQEEYLGHTHAA